MVLITAVSILAPFFGRRALVWLADAGSLAAVAGYLLVAVAFLGMRRRHPNLPRPYRTPLPSVVGVLALLATLFFVLLYLPGSPSALVWPQEWLIVLMWATLGVVFAMGIRRRVTARGGRTQQASLILGEYAEPLGLGASGGLDASRPHGAGSEEVKA